MSAVFVDTSALIALIDADDRHHAHAKRIWKAVLLRQDTLISTNYVFLEAFAVAQSQLGLEAARTFQESFFPFLAVEWVDRTAHEAAVTGVLTAKRKKLSLVDCVSFEVMRRRGIRKFFAFDRHFREQGFTSL